MNSPEKERDTLVEIPAAEDSGIRTKIPSASGLDLLPKGIIRAYVQNALVVGEVEEENSKALAKIQAISTEMERREESRRAEIAQILKLSLDFRRDLAHVIERTHLYPLFDSMKTFENMEELKPVAAYNQRLVITYCQTIIDDPRFHRYILPMTLVELQSAFSNGDWLSKKGIKTMREELYSILDIPLERPQRKDRDTIPDIEFNEADLSLDESAAVDLEESREINWGNTPDNDSETESPANQIIIDEENPLIKD